MSNPAYAQTTFLTSVAKLPQLPPDRGYEVAFVGRSNAGKSSVLNTLCRRRNLARTSKTPGRTQLLNFFQMDEKRRLVDLPGYGFAKVPLAIQKGWQQLLKGYLETRKSLRGLVIIMDCRHPMGEHDLQMLSWAQAYAVEALVVLNKADKLAFGARLKVLHSVQEQLQAMYPAQPPEAILYSCSQAIGREALHTPLDHWLKFV